MSHMLLGTRAPTLGAPKWKKLLKSNGVVRLFCKIAIDFWSYCACRFFFKLNLATDIFKMCQRHLPAFAILLSKILAIIGMYFRFL